MAVGIVTFAIVTVWVSGSPSASVPWADLQGREGGIKLHQVHRDAIPTIAHPRHSQHNGRQNCYIFQSDCSGLHTYVFWIVICVMPDMDPTVIGRGIF
jgi:hypothetical protein